MKTYYSIIKIVPNSLTNDSISVGMIMSDDNKFFIKFSEAKIKIAKTLLGKNKNFIVFFLSQIENAVKKANTNKSSELFKPEKLISSKYLSTLHRYSNNVIRYQEPRYIKGQNNIETFNKLFGLLVVGNFTENPKKEKINNFSKTKKIIEQKLISKVKNKVHTNFKFTNKIIPSLYFNYEMDCIGLNGVFTGAKSLDFNQSEQTIQKELSNYFALSNILESKYYKLNEKNNFYLIAEEPDIINSKEHSLWERITKLSKFKHIYPEQSGIVADKIKFTNAAMFI